MTRIEMESHVRLGGQLITFRHIATEVNEYVSIKYVFHSTGKTKKRCMNGLT